MKSISVLVRPAAAVAVGILLAAAATTSAVADPSKTTGTSGTVHAAGATPAVIKLMHAQIALDRAADRIEAAIGDRSTSGLSGFVVDPANNVLNVYWHGAVPAEVNRVVQAADQAAAVRVAVHAAPYTRAELEAETDRIAKSSMTAKSPVQVVHVGPKADGTGLEVGVRSGSASGSRVSAAQVSSLLGATVPLDVEAAEQPVMASRYGDSEPYYGGAYMERWNGDGSFGGSCTTGFGVNTTSLNGRIMLSASHCGLGIWENGLQNPGPDPWGKLFMGGSWPTDDRAHDAQLISMRGGARIYDGGSIQGEAAQFSKPVKGAFGNRTGDYICTSGSFSGANCGIRVAATGQSINVGGFGTVRNTIRAEKDDRTAAVGNGDSGGPAFSLTSDSTGVYARGTITAISGVQADWRACRGVPSGPNSDPNARHCSWKFWYPDILVQMQELGRLNNTSVTIATS